MDPPQSPTVSNPTVAGWSRSIERLRTATAGRFTILRELGRGGFATVFLAQQHKPNRRVAIKLLSPALLDSDWALEHFRGESQKIAEWRHQSVVTIYEVHEEDALLYFVMSYVEGASLYELLQLLGPLPIAVVRSVLAQVGSALNYAHRQGVTHRDIKPHNILVDVDGGAVVTDFGIAKQMDGTSHTITGMIVGTAPYMAPEQCESGKTSAASDQYALGIVAHEMLVGTPPFTGAPMAVLMAHLQQPIPAIRERRPDCPPELEAAVLRMLAKKPADRFDSVAAAVHAAAAVELSDAHPDRRWFAESARLLAARQQAPVLDIVSMPPVIEVGERIPIGAQARTTAGEPLADVPVEWSGDEAGRVRLDVEQGTLTGLQPGRTSLVVRGGGVEQHIHLEVRPPQPGSVVVQGPDKPLRVGDLGRLSATVTSHHGATIQASVHWQSAQPQLATIGPDGVLRAHAAGRVRVTASAGTANGELWVEIAPPLVDALRITGDSGPLQVGEHRPLSAIVLDVRGQPLSGRLVHWSSSDPEIALVSATGEVTACAAGVAAITATCEERTATLQLTIREPPVTALELAAPSSGLHVGDRIRIHATVRAADGRALSREVEWSSEDPAVATVSTDGAVTAMAPGVAVIAAVCEGVRSTTRLRVVPSTAEFVAAARPRPVAEGASGATAAIAPDRAIPAAPAPAAPAPAAPAADPVAGVTAWIPSLPATPSPELTTAELSGAAAADVSEVPAAEPAPPPAATASTDERRPARQKGGGSVRARRSYAAGGIALLGVAALAVALRGRGSMDGRIVEPSASPPQTVAASPTPAGPAGNPATVGPTPPAAVDAPPIVAPPVSSTAAPSAVAPSSDESRQELARADSAAASPLVVRATSTRLRVGDSLVVRATRGGQPATRVSWRSTERAVATVSAAGTVRALGAGRVGIVGAAGGTADTVVFTVEPSQPSPKIAATPPVEAPVSSPPRPPANAPVSGNPPAAPGRTATTPTPAAPSAADAAAAADGQLRRVVDAYAAAIRGRSLDEVQRLYPAMSPRERDGWRSFFDFARDLQVGMRVEALSVSDATATARVSGEYRYTNPATKRPCQQPLTMQMRFARAGTGWQISGIDQQQGRGSGC